MKVRIDLNNPALIKARQLTGIDSDKVIIEKALELFIATQDQRKQKGK